MYSTTDEGEKLSSSTSAQPCRFSLAEIQSATKDFDDELVIGRGGFGKVYKGHICSEETSLVVAIKRLDSMSNQGAPEFRAEIEMLSKLRHCHLVSLIGYCDDNKEMILVYEYMPNGTLYDHLHKTDTPLNWVQRLKIAIGAARGLDYLHTGVDTQHGIIHRDVKSSNILLDEKWAARISDFGLSRFGPINQSTSFVDASVKGTFGYLDPEYFFTQKLTRKTDVFAFGVVLFELLSSRLAVDIRFGEDKCSLVRWAQKCVKERRLDQLVDSNIRGTIFPKCLRRFAQIADRCLHSSPKERPTMTVVVASIQLSLTLQEKYDNAAGSSGITGFTSKMHQYFGFSTKYNSEHTGTNLGKSAADNMAHSSLIKEDADDHRETLLKVFTYSELECATRGFGNQTPFYGRTYGEVYKGWVDELTYAPSELLDFGLAVDIRRIHCHLFESPEKFDKDLKMLREFSHPNLVKLIGYCLEDKELFLVYEFMHNGNFVDCLRNGAVARLSLVTRVKMAVGIARGLVFFINKVGETCLNRRNIFLDEDFTAKLSGYDLMKLVGRNDCREVDNRQLACYYYPGRRPSLDELWTDTHGFIVVFAEVLTGKQIYNEEGVDKMNQLLFKDGIIECPDSLFYFANLCFEICNEEYSESKMLRVLHNFDNYITA